MSAASDRIRRIFDECGTDKGDVHGYETFYATLQRPASVLEIGVYFGASLRAWRKIWDEPLVEGVDAVSMPESRSCGCRIYIANSTMEYRGRERYDLIIDDGSHAIADQFATWRLYGPHAGIYVIEDVTREAIPVLGDGWNVIETGNGFDDRILWRADDQR